MSAARAAHREDPDEYGSPIVERAEFHSIKNWPAPRTLWEIKRSKDCSALSPCSSTQRLPKEKRLHCAHETLFASSLAHISVTLSACHNAIAGWKESASSPCASDDENWKSSRTKVRNRRELQSTTSCAIQSDCSQMNWRNFIFYFYCLHARTPSESRWSR